MNAGFASGTLLLTCFDMSRRRFAGMRRIAAELDRCGAAQWESWSAGRTMDVPHAREVILCGHGSEQCARLGDGGTRFLLPGDLRLERRARLYLLGCYQGRDELRRLWESGTGVAAGNARGADGETETLLSTLFLLHLAEESGTEELFSQWVLANRLIRPAFGPARELYVRNGGDPLAVLDWLIGVVDLSPVRPFLALARRKPEYLTGLVDAE